MTRSCYKCGRCCQVIRLDSNIFDPKYKGEKVNADYLFMKENWNLISYEKAIKINPYLIKWFEKAEDPFRGFFYTCKQYNPITKKCLVHNNKPLVCSKYPYYDRNELPDDELPYSEECGYHNNLSKV